MVKRPYRILTLAGGGVICLLITILPAQSGMAPIESEKNLQMPPAVTQQAAAKNKTSRHKKAVGSSEKREKPQASEFVALSSLILDAAPVPHNLTNIGSRAFDPALIDRILGTKTTGGGTDRTRSDHEGVHKNYRSIATNLTQGKIGIQPMVVRGGTPPLRNFVFPFSPELMVLTPDGIDTLSEEVHDFGNTNAFRADAGSREQQGPVSDNPGKGSKAPFSYSYKTDQVSLNTGVSWINDITDSRSPSRTLQKVGYDSTADKVPGVNLNLGASYGALSLTGGYLHAIDRYAPTQPSYLGNEIESGVWSSEFAYTTELLRKETTLAVGYQNSSESLKLYLPKQRYVTKASMALFDGTTLSVEYYLDRDSYMDNGVNGNGYGVATKVGFEFQ